LLFDFRLHQEQEVLVSGLGFGIIFSETKLTFRENFCSRNSKSPSYLSPKDADSAGAASKIKKESFIVVGF
jgi:hypothetical protein